MAGSSNNYNTNESKIKTTQAEVEEVVGIMRNNLEKVLERDTKLSELHDRADALNHGAFQFEKQAQTLKKKMWWQNMRMKIIIAGGIAVFLLIIIVWIVSSSKEGE